MKQEQIKTDDYKAEDYYQSLNQTVNLEEKIERFNNSFNYETLIGTLNLKRLCNSLKIINFSSLKGKEKGK